jgi:hypothetical protein
MVVVLLLTILSTFLERLCLFSSASTSHRSRPMAGKEAMQGFPLGLHPTHNTSSPHLSIPPPPLRSQGRQVRVCRGAVRVCRGAVRVPQGRARVSGTSSIEQVNRHQSALEQYSKQEAAAAFRHSNRDNGGRTLQVHQAHQVRPLLLVVMVTLS